MGRKTKTKKNGATVRAKAAKTSGNGKAEPKRRVAPMAAKKKNEWRTVLRLPGTLARKLKKAASNNDLSINTAVETVIGVWVKSEGL